jgi:ubiquinone/menaquinone biosynthesis C-methylase UbiE
LQNKKDWFKSEFVELKKGDALNLPIENESIDIAAQNCLFNILKQTI